MKHTDMRVRSSDWLAAPSACGPILDAAGLCVGWFNRRRGLELVECEKRAADEIISRYHYSKKPTKNSFCSLLVMRRGVSLGAIQLGYGIRPKLKSGDSDTIREFDRMWLSDELPRFTETVVLAMLRCATRFGAGILHTPPFRQASQ